MDTKTEVSKDEVLVSREGAIVTLTFNRPEARNAMTWGMYQRLYEVCEEVDADESIRVLVLKGAGGKAFVAHSVSGACEATFSAISLTRASISDASTI